MPKARQQLPPIESREFRSVDEIDRAMASLRRRIQDLEGLDISKAVASDNGAIDVARSDVRNTIRDVFGPNSPEFREHQHLDIWAGPMMMNMSFHDRARARDGGRRHTIGILNGLVRRLEEKRLDLADGAATPGARGFDSLGLHPRIADVSRDLVRDGHVWEAVFNASKALINLVKERSSRHDLDGANLMRTVFTPKNPVLAFSDLSDQTQLDEQEGLMHMFAGAVLAIRNPLGHSFPSGSEQRAMEYLSLLSLLAFLAQEAKRRTPVPP